MPQAFSRPGHHKNQFFDLLEALPLIVYSVEPFPPFLPMYVSPGIEVLGYSRAEWLEIPDRWVRSLDARDQERVLIASEHAMSRRELLDIEYRLVARDGTVRWFHDRGKFVFDDDGAPVEFRGVLLDITDRKTAQLQLIASRDRLERTQVQLDLAQQPAPLGRRGEALAHELNNLLQIIGANTALIEDETADRPRVVMQVGEIRDAIRRAAIVADQLIASSGTRGSKVQR